MGAALQKDYTYLIFFILYYEFPQHYKICFQQSFKIDEQWSTNMFRISSIWGKMTWWGKRWLHVLFSVNAKLVWAWKWRYRSLIHNYTGECDYLRKTTKCYSVKEKSLQKCFLLEKNNELNNRAVIWSVNGAISQMLFKIIHRPIEYL